MRLAKRPRTFPYHCCRQTGTRRGGGRLWLESLEDRTVPSILFDSGTTATTSDGGGPVIDKVHVELIFWGSGWDTGNGPALRSQTEAAVDSITGGPYLSQLSEYRASIGSGSRLGSVTINTSSPAHVFNDTDVELMLLTNITNQTLPNQGTDSQLLYVVIPQPGSTANFGGYHSALFFGAAPVHYEWMINPGDLDTITYFFSHELAEAVSDPEGTAIQVNPRSAFGWNEICDLPAQNYSYRLNGYLVNSWFSQANDAYIVPTAQGQSFFVSSNRTLTVNGDQLPDANDSLTIDQENSGYKLTLNGEVAQFDARDFYTGNPAVRSITVNTGSGDDTVNIEGTIATRPVTINLGDGNDRVNLSPTTQNLNYLAGTVTINGGSGADTLNLFDQGNTSNRDYTLSSGTLARNGMATVTYQNLTSVALNTSNGTDSITVQSTPSGTAVAITGGSGSDTLAGSAVDNMWNITGSNAGTLQSANVAGPVSFSSVQNLIGGPANNTFVFADSAGISGNLDGGGAGSLNYSAYSSSVIVDLQTATATGVGGSLANIQNVTGGSGGGAGIYNILVGNGGNTLMGGSGRRNLLIAGSSASTLIGGDDDDILIGGTTAYDTDIASLMAIMDYWSAARDDYGTRVGNLLAGSGVPLLDPTTVTSNGGGNALIGGPGLNLYYGSSGDTTDFDPNSGAVFVPI